MTTGSASVNQAVDAQIAHLDFATGLPCRMKRDDRPCPNPAIWHVRIEFAGQVGEGDLCEPCYRRQPTGWIGLDCTVTVLAAERIR